VIQYHFLGLFIFNTLLIGISIAQSVKFLVAGGLLGLGSLFIFIFIHIYCIFQRSMYIDMESVIVTLLFLAVHSFMEYNLRD
jgi:hypothetical protein